MDVVELGLDGGVAVAELVGLADEFGQVDGGDADAVALENLLAVADGVERARPGADGTQPHAAHAIHHAADPHESIEIGAEAVRSRMRDVLRR